MKKISIILIIIMVMIAYIVWSKYGSTPSSVQVFTTQLECERANGSTCHLQLCDYKCPNDFKKGWVQIDITQ